MSYQVVGQTRDWAFLAASDIEERLKKLKKVSFIRLLSNRAILFSIMVVFMITAVGLSVLYNPPGNAVEKLAEEHEQGNIADAIQAIIYLERAKVDLTANAFFVGAMFSMPVILILISVLLPILFPEYNFYWGDYISYYDKRASISRLMWRVIVLGVSISVVAGLILRNI